MKYIKWIILAAAVVIAIMLPNLVGRYTLFILYLMCMNVCLAQSWNLLGGYTGLVSLGHAAFFGIGGYTTAMLAAHWGAPFTAAVIAGGVLAMLFSMVMAIPVFRFRGIYFAIGTLVLAEALRIWMINWGFTGGAQGVHLPPETALSLRSYYFIMLGMAAGVTVLIYLILHSKLGLGLRAIRDNEDSAQNMGVNTFRTKLTAFMISAFVAGVTGGIHAAKMSTIEPYSIFSAGWTFAAVNIVIIGGIGTIWGPVLGAIFVTYLEELLADYSTYHLIITGVILILVIRFIPKGLWGAARDAKSLIRMSTRFAG